MNARLFKIIIVIATVAYSSSAMALFDVQLQAGNRWYILESPDEDQNLSARELTMAAHFSPIPVLPLAIGASGSSVDFSRNDLDENVTESKLIEAGLDLMLWVPMVPAITPYARIKYPLVSSWVTKIDTTVAVAGVDRTVETVTTAKMKGLHVNLGFKYSPAPGVGFLFEYGMGMQKYALERVTTDGEEFTVSDEEATEMDGGSKAFLVGLEVGL